MKQSRTLQTIYNHYRYVKLEGWPIVQHRLYRTDDGGILLTIEYWDLEGGNQAGQFWPIKPEEIDDVQYLLFDLEIPVKPLQLGDPGIDGGEEWNR